MPQPFQVGVKALIKNTKTNKFLLLERVRPDRTRFWDLPGGRIEPSESMEDTLKRELREELPGFVDFQIKNHIGVERLFYVFRDGSCLFLNFFAVETTTEDINISDEHASSRWVGSEEITTLANKPNIELGAKLLSLIKNDIR